MEKRRFDPILIQGRPESIFFFSAFHIIEKNNVILPDNY